MSRVYNFSAGPAAVPVDVLKKAQQEMLEWHDSGMSVMEMSHRGKDFISIAEKAEADVRELMNVPENYKVLFLQGGATTQFSMVPMNLLRGKEKTCYVNTGAWSKKAIKEAKIHSNVHISASSESTNFTTIPAVDSWDVDQNAAYLHYTSNETIGGVEFHSIPDVGDIDLVADMSSNILSREFDVSKFGVIYAGGQKNMGPSGIALTIVRDDLIGNVKAGSPSMMDYKNHADAGSMFNTPATYSWYLMGLVFEWIKEQGGVSAIEAQNVRKAEKLYAAIDNSDFYANPVELTSRSRMNIPFTLANAELEGLFLSEAKSAGLVTLKGHRSVGGMRASIYNAMPEEGVDALISMMAEFERTKA
ncbi:MULTISPECIES: 3-phosphoserine/phosphohydroxythreonine transaminase [Cycloclasticus]|jgi:phosphoserine aminotransferase|uniref:Phosphoserine aminotransferase n=1 Tax=Cycloclasticus zancles 78-ME TaxID=1198232 RepID=S5TZ14_9GAMM|nr:MULTISPECIES: 3-phosphoserine/phosphohydroxythreonine transaminase [Cycloclasticus]AGS40228.1 Phosphoserine aminotransferase [Cycloclasticus zancles 78-ME]MBV1898500.1 3-phosphoserine/phosphohydroxythreonine transaminase [Cycloclasticus sp.]